MRRLEASLRRATPKGHETFISHTAPHQGLSPTSSPPCVQDTPRHPQANASLDEEFTHNGELMSLRLIYLHMIEEYARHLGHADLLRERTDGVTGV